MLGGWIGVCKILVLGIEFCGCTFCSVFNSFCFDVIIETVFNGGNIASDGNIGATSNGLSISGSIWETISYTRIVYALKSFSLPKEGSLRREY